MKPKEFERRLAAAYHAGYFDGHIEGTHETHKMWHSQARLVRGIGPKRMGGLMHRMDVEIQRRLAEHNMLPSDPELKEALDDERDFSTGT